MKNIKVNIYQIEEIAQIKCLKEFAVFLYFKKQYKNGIYRKWSYRSISKKTGLSRTAVKKYIDLFINFKWVFEFDDDLVFRGPKNCFEYRQATHLVELDVSGSIKDIHEKLNLLIFKEKHSKCLYKKRREEKKNGNKECVSSISISTKSIGRLYKCSKSTASRMINMFEKNKWVNIIRGFKRLMPHKNWISKEDFEFLKYSIFKGAFWNNGKVLKYKANEYAF